MMESQVDRELLEKIADLIGKPVGAFNIRKDTGCDGTPWDRLWATCRSTGT